MNKLIVKAQTALWQFKKNQDGAALVEYSLLIGLITVLVVTLIASVGGWVLAKWTLLDAAVNP